MGAVKLYRVIDKFDSDASDAANSSPVNFNINLFLKCIPQYTKNFGVENLLFRVSP